MSTPPSGSGVTSARFKAFIIAAIVALAALIGVTVVITDDDGDPNAGGPTTTTAAPTDPTTEPTTTVEPVTTTTETTTTVESTTAAPPVTTTTTQPAGCPNATPNTPDGPDGNGGCFPGPVTAGVPAGTVLAPYTGPAKITQADTVIDGANVNTYLEIRAPGVVIRNSKVNGPIDVDQGGTLRIERSDVDGGTWVGTAFGWRDTIMDGVNLHGAYDTMWCAPTCTVTNSYIHDQYAPSNVDTHNDAIQIQGGSGMTFTHNTIWCTPQVTSVGGGCSSNLSMLAWDAAITNVLIERNLFPATPSGSYCMYGGGGQTHGAKAANIRVLNNVFQRGSNGKCGAFGPVTDWRSGNGNVWDGNVWDNGGLVPAAG